MPRFRCLKISLDAIHGFYFGGQAKEVLEMISNHMFLVNIYIYNSWEGGEHIEIDVFPLNYKFKY